MSAKCIQEILGKAAKMGMDFTEREAGDMFRRIRETRIRYEKGMSSPQLFLEGMGPEKPQGALHGEVLRRKLLTLSPEDRLREYARIAFEDNVREKTQALKRSMLQAEKSGVIEEKLKAAPEKPAIKALNKITVEADYRKNAIATLDMADMTAAIDKYNRFFGYKATREEMLNIVREIDRPGSTEDVNARGLAEVWTKGREASRERMNSAGADIGRLRDWKMPQIWDDRLYEKAGVEKFVNDAMEHIDRARYWDSTTGKYLTDQQTRDVLAEAWKTVVTDGLNQPPTEQGGRGSLARRLGAHRELHFKDADGWFAMNEKYGQKDVLTLMPSTIMRDAGNLAILETYGPSPKAGFDAAYALAKHLDLGEKVKWWDVTARNYFEELTGANSKPVNRIFADYMQATRHWIVSSKLGGVLLSQPNDAATALAIAHTDGLGTGKLLRLVRKNFDPRNSADQQILRRQGILSNVINQDVAMRYGEGVKGSTLSSRFASATVKLSGMEWWTNAWKSAYQMLIGFHMNDAVEKGIDSQGPKFRKMLDKYGIGPAEWEIIKQAEAVTVMGEKLITPTTVKLLGDTPQIRETALKVATMMGEEADIGIVSPGLRERALVKRGTKAGTIQGELLRSTMLFKTFSLSMLTKVIPRIFNREAMKSRDGLATAAAFSVGMIALGGVSYQLKRMAKGLNPLDMFTAKFGAAAIGQSGGLGILSDFFFSDVNRFGGGFTETVAGPVAGLAESMTKLTLGNIQQALGGRKTDVAAETIQFVKNNAPLINLWYTRLALDHALFFGIQEWANPGYLRRMKRRMEKDSTTKMFWNPENALPQSAPDIAGAFGGR